MISLYLSQKSWLHDLHAGVKLLGLLLASVLIYPVSHLAILCSALILTLALYAGVGQQALKQLGQLKPLLWLFTFIFLMQIWTVGVYSAALMILRMLVLILLANLITLTTRMDDMMSAITPVFYPLTWFGINPKRIAFAITLVIRFVPVLMAIMQQLMEAWHSRGGGKSLWKLAVPLTIQAIRLSDHVAEALSARGGLPTQPTSHATTTENDTHDPR